MRPLSSQDIEAELSYAYLHAVASKAGMSCRISGRHEDNNGVDATLTAWGPFAGGGYLTEIDIKVQLKATIKKPADDGEAFSFFLRGVTRYDDLRIQAVDIARILVILFLPEDPQDWLSQTEDLLTLRKCAYWQSLRGAPITTNDTGATVYLPKAQVFSPEALTNLATRLSRRDFPNYPVAS